MSGIESKLDSQMFMRVHRSAIVNLKYVKEVRRENSGDKAVGGARSLTSLKSAQSAENAIAQGRQDFARGFASPAAPASTSSRLSGGSGSGNRPLTGSRAGGETFAYQAQQSRFVSGKSFFQNGEQWVDSEIQKMPDAKRVRVQFNSPEYFELLTKNPRARAWLSQGRNVQFAWNGTIYEIFSSE